MMMAMGFSLPFAVQSIYRFSPSYDPKSKEPIDAVVCLAGAKGRISAAAEVFIDHKKAGLKSTLYLSGMGSKADFSGLSIQLSPELLAQIQADEVYIEAESANTVQNAEWFFRIARERGWKSIVLVTSDYHMKRASYIFEALSKKNQQPVKIRTWATKSETAEIQEQLRFSFIEFVKGIYYRYIW